MVLSLVLIIGGLVVAAAGRDSVIATVGGLVAAIVGVAMAVHWLF